MPGISLEDLRNDYKSNKKSKSKSKYPSAATSRTILLEKPLQNTIQRIDTTSRNNKHLNEINEIYCVNDDRVTYSLDKKKRWQITSDLVSKLDDFKQSNTGVKVFETAPIGGSNKGSFSHGSNVLAYYNSSTGSDNKQSGNYRSITEQERAEEQRQRIVQIAPVKVKKPNRFKPVNRFQKSKTSGSFVERIVIRSEESESEDENEAYNGTSQYFIEYKPTRQELKKTQKYRSVLATSYENDRLGYRFSKVRGLTRAKQIEVQRDELGTDVSESDECEGGDSLATNVIDLEQLTTASKAIEFEELVSYSNSF